MKNSKKLFAVILALCLIVTSAVVGSIPAGAEEDTFKNDNDLLMWYDKPASTTPLTGDAGSTNDSTGAHNRWQQTILPIGNGYMGGSVYGEISKERILLNEESLWTGGPSASRTDYNGGNLKTLTYATAINAAGTEATSTTTMAADQVWKKIVDGFASGKAEEIALAKFNCRYLVGQEGSANGNGGYGSFQPFANLYLDFGIDANSVTNYRRTLDLKTAVATVEFDYKDAHYTREYFMSYPKHVMGIKLTTTAANGMNVTTSLESIAASKNVTVTAQDDTVTLKGQLSDNEMNYNGKIKIVPDTKNGGEMSIVDSNKIKVSGTKSVTMFLSLSTNYVNDYDKHYRTDIDTTDADNETRIEDAAKDGYDAVRQNHLEDYQNLFNRVELKLGQVPSNIPTNQLLNQYKAGTASEELSRGLEVMLFQYGRYLTIASSREGSLPSNLQGVWNVNTNPPWSSDYHMNVNLQMNYWPTYSTNLAECAKPLVDYVDSLRKPGRVTASTYFGIDNEGDKQNGFTANTQNTIFGWTCPGWSFSWGWSPAAVPWILQNCYEYYEYTKDKNYLETEIYPMMLEECKFYNTILKEIDGRWVTAPSYSPEHGPYTAGNTYESTLVWQLFNDTIEASKILEDKDNEDLIKSITEKMNGLDPIQVGDSGQIKEWFGAEEGKLGMTGNGTAIGNGYQSGHRHLSHMLGLFPGDLIQTKDEWVKAAEVSMINRGDDATGWGVGQRINTWARLRDGDHALLLIKKMFQNAIYPNLWDAHAPFQIDGNFGMTSGVAEMLLQSNMGFVDILPALPTEWDEGSVSGLVARGNFEVTTSWKNGIATEIKITSKEGEKCVVGYDDFNENPVVTKNGETVQTTKNDKGQIEFETEKGATYTITGFKLPTVHNAEATYYPNNTVDIAWDELEGMNYEVVRVDEKGNESVLVESTDKCEYIDDLGDIDPKKVSYEIITVSEDSESDPVEVEVTPDEIFVKYDQSKMTATACSKASDSREELADGPAENVLDGNDKTFWHTNYNGKEDVTLENGHHWIEIDLGGVYEVSYVTYLPRQNSPNGRITKYELIVTKEDNTTATFTGDLEDNTDEKILPLDKPTKIKKFRIHALAANGDTSGTHCTAAEINVYNNKIIELGDVDRGGSIDSTDVTKLQKVLAGYEVDDYNAVYSDVNGDDTVNIKDATRIQKAIVGIKPIEDNNPYLVS